MAFPCKAICDYDERVMGKAMGSHCYRDDAKVCLNCEVKWKTDRIRCPCCNRVLRVKRNNIVWISP